MYNFQNSSEYIASQLFRFFECCIRIIFGGETFECQKVRIFVVALGSQPHDMSVATAFLSQIGQFDHVWRQLPVVDFQSSAQVKHYASAILFC